jgi:methionine sulfoxide reductase catalytic subunit
MHYHPDRGFQHSNSSELTPQTVYEHRRDLIKLMALGGMASQQVLAQVAGTNRPGKLAALPTVRGTTPGAMLMEKFTAYDDVVGYNNFYEFGTDKADPARNAKSLKTRPWTVSVEGEVKRPKVFDIEELLKLSAHPVGGLLTG